MPQIPKPLDSSGIERFFFGKEYEKSAPEFMRTRLSIIHFYLNDDENGWHYDARYFAQDFEKLNAIYKAGVNYLLEEEGDYFRFNYLSSVEVALAQRDQLALNLRCRPAVYLALLNVALIKRYLNNTSNEKGEMTDANGPLLIEIGQGLAALRNWSFGQPAETAAVIEEMRRRGARGAALRDRGKREIIQAFIDEREQGRLRSCKSDAAAYRSFVQSMSEPDKRRYRGSRAASEADPAAIDFNIEQSLKKAYQKHKRGRGLG